MGWETLSSLRIDFPERPIFMQSGPGRGVKRKRTTIVEEDISELATEHSGKGNVVVEPLDKDGKFVQVKNVSEGQINIGGWTLTNTHDGKDVSYKFHRAINLEAGEVTTVWSSDSREVHKLHIQGLTKSSSLSLFWLLYS